MKINCQKKKKNNTKNKKYSIVNTRNDNMKKLLRKTTKFKININIF